MPKTANYSAELSKLGWHREETFAFVADGREYMGDEYSSHCHAYRTLYRAPRYMTDEGQDTGSASHADIAPLIVTVKELFGWPCTARQISLGAPATLEAANAGLHWMMLQVRYKPYVFCVPELEEWYARSVAKLVGDRRKDGKDLLLHSELWKRNDSLRELWALALLKENGPSPKEAIERSVWLWATGRDTTMVLQRRVPR